MFANYLISIVKTITWINLNSSWSFPLVFDDRSTEICSVIFSLLNFKIHLWDLNCSCTAGRIYSCLSNISCIPYISIQKIFFNNINFRKNKSNHFTRHSIYHPLFFTSIILPAIYYSFYYSLHRIILPAIYYSFYYSLHRIILPAIYYSFYYSLHRSFHAPN